MFTYFNVKASIYKCLKNRHIRLDTLSKQKLEKAQLTLSNNDRDLFLTALENPPAKNAKLNDAIACIKK